LARPQTFIKRDDVLGTRDAQECTFVPRFATRSPARNSELESISCRRRASS
jgi:hypothetical protein